jgi:hypothetical protein
MKPPIHWLLAVFRVGTGFAKEKLTIRVDSGDGSIKFALLFPRKNNKTL